MYRLGIAAGGTGGHIIPALNVAKQWMSMGHDCLWFGRCESLEERLVREAGIPFRGIQSETLRASRWSRKPEKVMNILKGCREARSILKKENVHALFSTGGYVSFAPGLAARSAGIPLIIHEQNTRMGLANRVLSNISHAVVLGMPLESNHPGCDEVLGNPVAFDIPACAPSQETNLLIIGGSQGCRFLNRVLPQVLLQLSGLVTSITHIAGKDHVDVAKAYRDLGLQATVYDYCTDMESIYRQAQVVVSRSGAMTLAELAHFNLPSILIPYPHAAADHQRYNAEYFSHQNAAVLVEEHEASEERLLHELKSLLGQESLRLDMQAILARLAKPNAPLDIVTKILTVIE